MPDQPGKIIPIEANLPHKVSEVICVRCGRRWIDVRPADDSVWKAEKKDALALLSLLLNTMP